MFSTASIEGHLSCVPSNEEALARLAEAIDKFVGHYPRSGGYDLAGSVAAILSGGTHEQIVTAMHLLRSWEFTPKGGW